jgi:hypothetical protein
MFVFFQFGVLVHQNLKFAVEILPEELQLLILGFFFPIELYLPGLTVTLQRLQLRLLDRASAQWGNKFAVESFHLAVKLGYKIFALLQLLL